MSDGRVFRFETGMLFVMCTIVSSWRDVAVGRKRKRKRKRLSSGYCKSRTNQYGRIPGLFVKPLECGVWSVARLLSPFHCVIDITLLFGTT